MSRDGLTSAMQSALVADVVRPILLCDIETAGTPVRAWTGVGDLVWGAITFLGVGKFGGVTPVSETSELRASGITFTLDGVASEMISTALGQIRQGKSAKLYLGALDISTGALIADPYLIFNGLTDVPTVEDSAETATIGLTAENRLIDLERPRVRRNTQEDQKLRDATDLGFEYVPSLQDAEFVW